MLVCSHFDILLFKPKIHYTISSFLLLLLKSCYCQKQLTIQLYRHLLRWRVHLEFSQEYRLIAHSQLLGELHAHRAKSGCLFLLPLNAVQAAILWMHYVMIELSVLYEVTNIVVEIWVDKFDVDHAFIFLFCWLVCIVVFANK